MKVLHVNIARTGGGLEQYLDQLFKELFARGHRNLLLYGEDSDATFDLPAVKRFFLKDIGHTDCEDLKTKIDHVQVILDQEKPDLVFIHQVLNPSLIGFLTKQLPSLRFVHGFKMICPDGRKMLKAKGMICPFPLSYHCQLRAYLYRCMPRNPFVGLPQIRRSRTMTCLHKTRSRMIVASEFMKSILLYNGFKEKRIEYIPLFTYPPGPEVSVPPRDDPIILGVGRIVAEKGMDYLIRAFARISHRAKLVILGEGPALDSLKFLAQELNLSERVSFPGWLPHERVGEFFRRCTLLVVPSVAAESFGMVGIEAMSYGKPVLAFDVGGISDWLQHGETGFLLPPRDEGSLAEKMNLLVESPGLAEQMGRIGRKVVEEKFSPDRHLKRLVSICEEEIESFRQNDNGH